MNMDEEKIITPATGDGQTPQGAVPGQTLTQKYQKYLLPGGAVLAAIVVIAAVLVIGGRLNYVPSDASCYGYGCQPTVTLGARVPSYGYGAPLSYGTLTVNKGQSIELSWSAQNVDRCYATERWTSFQGLYYPPTLFPNPITASRTFGVTCLKANRIVATSTININVQTAPTNILSVSLSPSNPPGKTYDNNGTLPAIPVLHFSSYNSSQSNLSLISMKFIVDTNNNLDDAITGLVVIDANTNTQIALSSMKITTEKGQKIIIASFPKQVLQPSGKNTYHISAKISRLAAGPMRFTLKELGLTTKMTTTGLPVVGNYNTFVVVNDTNPIKSPTKGR